MEIPEMLEDSTSNQKALKKSDLTENQSIVGHASEKPKIIQKIDDLMANFKDDIATTESIDLMVNDVDVMEFALDISNANSFVKNTGNKNLSDKMGHTPEVASGMSTATTMSSKEDIQEEIEAIYKWVPDIANHFTILKKIGEGTFSSVYQARLRHYPDIDEHFALKHIVPTSHPSRIENELRCLLRIGGKDNVMGVKMCFRNHDHVIIVMPYFPHDKFQDYLQEMPLGEARDYMRNLLEALRRVHQFNVIHRDVKPSNFLYNRQTKEYALVDFGLASGPMLMDPARDKARRRTSQSTSAAAIPSSSGMRSMSLKAGPSKKSPRIPLSPSKKVSGQTNVDNMQREINQKKRDMLLRPTVEPPKSFARNFSSACSQLDGLCDCYGKPMICELCVSRNNQVAPRAGTAGFRAPEVLMKSPEQDTAVDMWSAGVIFLSLLSARYPFFRAQDDMGYLAQIISILGSKTCITAALSFGKLLTLNESIPSLDLDTACRKLRESQMMANSYENDEIFMSWSDLNSSAFDLLQKLLDPNPRTRITANAALQHPFFS